MKWSIKYVGCVGFFLASCSFVCRASSESFETIPDLGSDAGARSLASNTSWVNLQELILAGNQISDAGAIGLGANTAWVNLDYLGLKDNQIGAAVTKDLKQNKSWKNSVRIIIN